MTTLIPMALVALLAGADPGFDTVFLQNGGRVRGTVVEEDPARGVTVQIPGGQLRTVPPGEVFRIEYRDGTIGAMGAQPPPQPPKAAPPAPAAAEPAAPAEPVEPAPAEAPPAPPEPPRRAPPPPPPPGWTGRPPGEPVRPLNPGALRPPPGPRRPALFTFSTGLGFMVPSGNAAISPTGSSYRMSELTDTLVLVNLEGGVRPIPELTLGLYLDLGFGSPGTTEGDFCRSVNFSSCDAAAFKFGGQVRWSFTPFARGTPWVSLGAGGTALVVSPSDGGNDLTYSGREWRLGTGYDWRGNGVVGVGLFAQLGFGRYTRIEDYDGTRFHPDEGDHVWFQAGVRGILFP